MTIIIKIVIIIIKTTAAASLVDGSQVSLALDQEFCNFCMTFTSSPV
jgi:hypothetical protein